MNPKIIELGMNAFTVILDSTLYQSDFNETMKSWCMNVNNNYSLWSRFRKLNHLHIILHTKSESRTNETISNTKRKRQEIKKFKKLKEITVFVCINDDDDDSTHSFIIFVLFWFFYWISLFNYCIPIPSLC